MAGTKPLVLLDPHPRTRAMIFATDSWQRLQQFADVVTSEAGPVDAALVDECLPRLCAILGQTPMPEARLQRATALRAIFNVEGNFLPNVDYGYCFRHGIRVAVAAPAFAAPVAEYALALTLDLLRGVTRGDRVFRGGGEAYGWRGNAEAITLFDVYEGPQIGPGKRSLAYRLAFRAIDRTLSDADVNKLRAKIVRGLEREIGATIRG